MTITKKNSIKTNILIRYKEIISIFTYFCIINYSTKRNYTYKKLLIRLFLSNSYSQSI